MKQREYKDYEAYVQHQKEARWSGKEEEYFKLHHKKHLIEFRLWFATAVPHITFKDSRSICLGPSFCAEVVILRELGSNCIGLDLIATPPWSIAGDFHNVPFGDKEFDFVYSNALDHANDLNKFVSEAKRIVKPDGLIMFHLHLGQGCDRGYESMSIQIPEDILHRLPEFEVLLNQPIDPYPSGSRNMNWTLLLRKPK
ncbi:hypothetical protein LCGC14_0235460 [marine sediment metagenome]|uniref:Methyltransferase type 11 domain-containing protein n=1 Tax=marine sediment metagenome TaxID=412755 RepID=A0A0F9U8Y7_9ZZZZ